MIEVGLISHHKNDSNVVRIQQHGVTMRSFNHRQSLFSQIQHFGTFPEVHGTCRAGLDTGRQHSGGNPIIAHVAFGQGAIGSLARDVVRARLDDFSRIQAFSCRCVNNGPGGLIIKDGGWVSGGLQAGRFQTMAALVRKKTAI
jgi:hypothetical protein